jgi:hypothetical protein
MCRAAPALVGDISMQWRQQSGRILATTKKTSTHDQSRDFSTRADESCRVCVRQPNELELFLSDAMFKHGALSEHGTGASKVLDRAAELPHA